MVLQFSLVALLSDYCSGLEMAPHVNKWSPLDGVHE